MNHLSKILLGAAVLCQQILFADVTAVFDSKAEVRTVTTDGLGTPTEVKEGDPFKFDKKKAYWVQAKGKVPVLVMPAEGTESSPLRMQLVDVVSWPSSVQDQEIENRVGGMIDEIGRFQNAIARKDVQEAEKILVRLETTQNIAYLNFLRATLNFVKGDMPRAREYVTRGLRRYPANVQGQNLLKILEDARQ